MKRSIAFFDFDGTITSRDSFLEFLLYAFGFSRLALASFMLSPVLILHVLGITNNNYTKEQVYRYFFSGLTNDQLTNYGEHFVRDQLSKIIRRLALEKIQWHISEGHKVVIVTASLHYWVLPWAAQFGLDCLATHMEQKQGVLTGIYAGLNCHGEEKVRRILDTYNLSEFDEIYAYGDTVGDLPMLNLANHKFYKPFHDS
jgi:phosphatidylglycerophosphatase C